MKLLLLSILLISCVGGDELPSPGLTRSGNPQKAPAPTPSRWSVEAFPLALKIDESFTPQEQGLIEEMAYVWEDALAGALTFFPSTLERTPALEVGLDDYYDGIIGIYKHRQWFSEVGPQVLALTRFYGSYQQDERGETYIEMVHADIIFNYRDNDGLFTVDPDFAFFDLPTVALHEIGHLLGLGHTFADAIMYPSLDIGQVTRELKTPDTTAIQNLYDPVVVDPALSASRAPSPEDPPVGTPVQVTIYLGRDRSCRHYHDDRLVWAHRL